MVPLSRQAIATIEELRQLTGSGRYLFPQRKYPERTMSENTLLYALYRLGFHSRMTGHGVRAVASTILNETGFAPDVIERQLAHAARNKVRAAYNRSSYLAERRKMMQQWADMLDAYAKADSKIVPGKFRRQGR